MEDQEIVALYWQRDERAIAETSSKYGRYCHAIAYRILADQEDAEESVNDTYVHAWNGMPPHRPAVLSTFLGKITRRVSLHKWRYRTAAKRGGGQVALVLEELADCVPDAAGVEREVEAQVLTAALNTFLRVLPDWERRVFLCRYWYLDSIREISKQFGFSQSKVKSMLYRTRGKLLTYLRKEGVWDEG